MKNFLKTCFLFFLFIPFYLQSNPETINSPNEIFQAITILTEETATKTKWVNVHICNTKGILFLLCVSQINDGKDIPQIEFLSDMDLRVGNLIFKLNGYIN